MGGELDVMMSNHIRTRYVARGATQLGNLAPVTPMFRSSVPYTTQPPCQVAVAARSAWCDSSYARTQSNIVLQLSRVRPRRNCCTVLGPVRAVAVLSRHKAQHVPWSPLEASKQECETSHA